MKILVLLSLISSIFFPCICRRS